MMTGQRDVMASVDELLEALAGLRQATRATEAGIRRALKRAQAGVDVFESLGALDPAGARHSMNDALKVLEQARHEMRLAMFALALDQGMSIGELGRIFGFSRQLAARYAKEARGET